MAYIDIEIDKLTRSIENVVTGDSFPTEILPLSKPDLLHLTAENGWRFDWKKEYLQSDRDVFKLTILWNPTIIQGLMSIAPKHGYLEMYLIESAPFNYGKNKMHYGVAGNLVAFACKRSFELGFDGFVAFTAKTALIDHYSKTLGAVSIGGQRMAIEEKQAIVLIKRYFNEIT
ncbi:MAG: hypothetical protein LBE56_01545 [Tannerella sp.]|jgi:hypothetical protein|nr:hypothetical protein [Tannerella sp.]